MSTALTKTEQRTVGMAYILWLAGWVGISGVHRLYTGRYISGVVWLLTGGLCMVGQLVDAVFIPRMVEDHNKGRDVW